MSTSRVHFIDAARAMLMLLGIPYHAGLIYQPGNDWAFALSPARSPAIGLLADWIHFWRMPVFFVVAGFFASAMVQRMGSRPWFRNRMVKLGVPMVATLLVLNPWPLIVQDGPELHQLGEHWMAHLWFLPTLMALCGLWAMVPQWRLWKLLRWGNANPLTSLGIFLMLSTIMSGLGSMAGKHIPDVMFFRYWIMTTIGYSSFFLLGAVVQLSHQANEWITRNTARNTGIFLGCSAFLLYTEWTTFWPNILRVFILTLTGITATRVVFGISRTFFNKPSVNIRRVVDASFTIYLVHFPLLTIFWHPLHALGFGPVVEFVILCIIITLVSYMLHGFIVRNRFLLFMFNGTRNPTKENPNGATRFGD